MRLEDYIPLIHHVVPLVLMCLIGVMAYLYILSQEYQKLRVVKDSYSLLRKRLDELNSIEDKEKAAKAINDVKTALDETRKLMKELRLLQ